MAQLRPRSHDALPAAETTRLARALAESRDVTVFVNGTTVQLPPGATTAVVDLLSRLAQGDSVTIGSAEQLLNTSQAAELAGVSLTYMRRLTDNGTIPVEYRGSHRRIRPKDVLAWLAERPAKTADAGPA
jgi:excisionase family DNA binding protein